MFSLCCACLRAILIFLSLYSSKAVLSRLLTSWHTGIQHTKYTLHTEYFELEATHKESSS